MESADSTERNNWFVSLSTGFCLGGPGSGIVGAYNDQGFDQSSAGWFGSTSYPINTPKARLLFMAGKRITKSGSLYLVIGQPVGGVVQGYNGSSVVSYDYSVFQYTLGYQFSFPNTTFRLGVGPSLFTLKTHRRMSIKMHRQNLPLSGGRDYHFQSAIRQGKENFWCRILRPVKYCTQCAPCKNAWHWLDISGW